MRQNSRNEAGPVRQRESNGPGGGEGEARGGQKQTEAPALLQVNEQRPFSIKVTSLSLPPAAGPGLLQDRNLWELSSLGTKVFISEKALGQVTWNLWAIA